MNAIFYQRVKSVFLEACEQPQQQRTAFLDRACNGDRELRFAVEDLLMHDDQPLDLHNNEQVRARLDDMASAASEHEHSERHAVLQPQSLIGRYRTVKLLGEGGMGVVYLAEQDSPRRTVALKLIASGRSTPQVLRRFEHEAQVLGRLQHPGIAQIFEAGTFETSLGRQPFFAMEYVQGQSLLEYVQTHELSVKACIELFARVCDGVEHAHQKGIIHRDLKPGNILVDSQSETPQPKILDFGVARMTDSDVQTTTMHTGNGQLVGTVAYMSPEQVAGDVALLDTRSDVYALGVILYQLLTGQFPYLVEGTMRDVMDAILTAEPRRPNAISRRIDHDVETILLKCLSKELPRRYQSAGELAQDLRRYLSGDPIQARRDSRTYVLRKTLTRYWAAAAITAAFVIVVTAGLAVSLGALRSAVQARDEKELQRGVAVSEAKKSKAVNEFLNEMLHSANPKVAQGRDILVRETLDDAARLLDAGHFKTEQEVEASIRMTLGEAYLALAKFDQAEHQLQTALDIRETTLGHFHADTARTLNLFGSLRREQSDYIASEQMRREAVKIFQAIKIGDHDDHASALMNLAGAVWSQGNMQEAGAIGQQAVDMWQRLHGPDDPSVAHAMASVAIILHQPAQCADMLRLALQSERESLGPKHPQLPRTLTQLAMIQSFSADFDDAEKNYLEALALNREIYGPNHPEPLSTVDALTFMYQSRGQLDRCVALVLEYQPAAAIAYGEKSLAYAHYLSAMADRLIRVGNIELSESASREALGILKELGREDDGSATNFRMTLMAVLIEKGEYSEVEAIARHILATPVKVLDSNHACRHQAKSILGECLARKHLFAEAETLMTEAYDSMINTLTTPEFRFFAARRLAALYEMWHTAQPDKGKAELAAHWRMIEAREKPTMLTFKSQKPP